MLLMANFFQMAAMLRPVSPAQQKAVKSELVGLLESILAQTRTVTKTRSELCSLELDRTARRNSNGLGSRLAVESIRIWFLSKKVQMEHMFLPLD